MLKIINKILSLHLNPLFYAMSFCTTLGVTITTVVAAENDAPKITYTLFNDTKWIELPGSRAVANVKDDFTKGAHLKLLKLSPGNKTVVHTHSHSYTVMVIKGFARHYEPNKPETQVILPAGSTWFIPANVPHVSECLAESVCIFATQSDGAFDFKLIN